MLIYRSGKNSSGTNYTEAHYFHGFILTSAYGNLSESFNHWFFCLWHWL